MSKLYTAQIISWMLVPSALEPFPVSASFLEPRSLAETCSVHCPGCVLVQWRVSALPSAQDHPGK